MMKHFLEVGDIEPQDRVAFVCRHCSFKVTIGRQLLLALTTGRTRLDIPTSYAGPCANYKTPMETTR